MHQNEIYKHNPKLIGMQDEEASPHPPPERGTTALWEAKRKESAPTHNSAPPVPCQRHCAMRRGFGCNLILNHIRCRNRIDKHNPKKP